jgi:hypothetical protein
LGTEVAPLLKRQPSGFLLGEHCLLNLIRQGSFGVLTLSQINVTPKGVVPVFVRGPEATLIRASPFLYDSQPVSH